MIASLNRIPVWMNRRVVLAAAICIGALSCAVRAQQPLELEKGAEQAAAARDPEGYWTSQRLQSAQQLDWKLSNVSAATTPELAQRLATMNIQAPTESAEFVEGAAPADVFDANTEDMLFAPAQTTQDLLAVASEVVPYDEGDAHAPFTSARVPPLHERLLYPYRTVGRLFFRTNTGRDSWCSAAVLRPRIILTAGHCVHAGSGGGSGWYSRWLFVPAYHNGQAPYQAWNWRWAVVPGSWAGGGGGVPNKADFAIIELEERRFGSQDRKIGEVVGYLGYHTNVLQRNHVKVLGYPGNHDGGNIMHQVDAGNWNLGGQNTVMYGSDMRGGSSGGPWIMNFGEAAAGQTGGLLPGRNRIVGVTSYGYVATGPKVQGSSILNQEFVDILNRACNHRAGNCP